MHFYSNEFEYTLCVYLLYWISAFYPENDVSLLSDCFSSLKTIHKFLQRNPQLQEILKPLLLGFLNLAKQFSSKLSKIEFLSKSFWIKIQEGHKGTELSDRLSKSSAKRGPEIFLPLSPSFTPIFTSLSPDLKLQQLIGKLIGNQKILIALYFFSFPLFI